MVFVKLTQENISDEHICCAIADKKCQVGYQKKKDWLSSQFASGYTFLKEDVRGKVFIEYVPIEASWLPLQGANFMVINCFWVSGQYKGKGNGRNLLSQAMNDASTMDGLVAITGDKKRPFMSDPKFLAHQGFEVIDEAPPFFRLWGLRTNLDAEYPTIMPSAKQGSCPDNGGITAYYSNTCPFTDLHTGQNLRNYANSKGIPIEITHIDSQAAGHKMPIPWIINSIFYRGELVTLEMKADRHLDKLIGS